MNNNTSGQGKESGIPPEIQGWNWGAALLYIETLALRKEMLGLKQHPDTLLSMNNLAALYNDQGRYEQAEPLYSETLALSKEILGLKHPEKRNTGLEAP